MVPLNSISYEIFSRQEQDGFERDADVAEQSL